MFTVLSFLMLSISFVASDSIDDKFQECISLQNLSIPMPIYFPNNASYLTIFNSSARNLRFLSANSTKPRFVITPLHESHFQAIVVCSRKQNLDLKLRSGGHDVEGLSYSSDTPFIIADLVNYRNITVDVEAKTAWIQAGAQLGEIYYRVAEQSKTLGFPGGFCPTVGVGGHISGGGIGALVRKYGLASDQVIDVRMVTVDGKLHNKESMGEDLFWAIRGGGANSFGVITSYKVNLVPVTANVTVATVSRTLEQNATSLVHKWQQIADKLHEDLYIQVTLSAANATQSGKKTVLAVFAVMFLGDVDNLLQMTQQRFPELGLERKDCIGMSWVESAVYLFARGSPLEILIDRDPVNKNFLKVKTDYVKEPMSEIALEGIWGELMEDSSTVMVWAPFGGRMNEISEFATPYPYRAGYIHNILYTTTWNNAQDSVKQIDSSRKFHAYMRPHVSMFPRAAYLNYKDLDLGVNEGRSFQLLKR